MRRLLSGYCQSTNRREPDGGRDRVRAAPIFGGRGTYLYRPETRWRQLRFEAAASPLRPQFADTQ